MDFYHPTTNGKDVKPFLCWNMPEIKQGYDEAVMQKNNQNIKNIKCRIKMQYNICSLGFSTLFIRAQQWENTVAKPF